MSSAELSTAKIDILKKLITFISILTLISGCHVGRYVIYNFANIDDYKKFKSRELTTSPTPFSFSEPNDSNLFKHVLTQTNYDSYNRFETVLEKNKTVAFLVIQNDSIKYEWYSKKNSLETIFTSFSMSKSYISALIGIAIEEGHIKSVNEPITNYIKSFKHDGFDSISIEHLLNMRTGIDYVENYFNPFGNIPVAYYGRNLDKHMHNIKIKEAPDQKFEYISIATQILGVILEEATGKTVTNYLQEKLWTPIGTEYNASWSLDKKDGREKSFCCINARARDFAKFGKLYLQMGKWGDNQVVPKQWIRNSVEIHANTKDNFYQHQWWLEPEVGKSNTRTNYMAQGILGQYIYVNPEKNTIIVRLGENWGKINWRMVFYNISKAI